MAWMTENLHTRCVNYFTAEAQKLVMPSNDKSTGDRAAF